MQQWHTEIHRFLGKWEKLSVDPLLLGEEL
jgi:hypothetical protein